MQETDNTLYSSLAASFSCIDWSYTVGMIEYGAHPTFLWVLWRNDYICQKTKKYRLRQSIETHQKQLENLQSQVSCYLKTIQLPFESFLVCLCTKFCWDPSAFDHGDFCWAFWGRGSFPPLSPGKNGKNKMIKRIGYLFHGSCGTCLD